ncbi:MAG TPA: saccharopine dehydrogenase NADP-binding domain-containing protein [Anaeromyxobacter sp.]
MAGPLLVYGAYGYTGELVARRAVERGLSPVLAGRDSEQLVRVARALGCEWRAFPVSDPEALRRGVRGAGAVVHCAGPFIHTARQMAEACIDERVHYLDVTGEIPVFESLLALSPAARNAGVMLLPGAGFDVVPSDCLAAHLARRLPGARTITLVIGGMDRVSRGTARTILEGASAARRGLGAIETRSFDLGFGPVAAVSVPWADVFTAPRSTGVPDVRTYLAGGKAFRLLLRAAPHLAPVLASRRVREVVAGLLAGGEAGPSPQRRATGRSVLYGEAVDASGRRVAARQRHPDAYTLTALAAVEIAERVLRGESPPGWQTPALAYGPDLVLALPDVSREDL